MKTETIPMSSPDIGPRERAVVASVLASSQLSIGPWLERFEGAFARLLGRRAVGVSSGTSGLHMAVIASGVGAGDLVLTSPFSFVASANCLLYEKAVPVFVDVEPETGNVDPALVDEAVGDLAKGGSRARRWLPRSGAGAPKRLKAILPVHAFGVPAEMRRIAATARRHRLAVIEDACEALGSEHHGRPAGAFGDFAVFAFYPNKQITTGEGGIVVAKDAGGERLLRSLRNQGRDVFDAWLNHSRLGYNYRLDEMSSALGAAQMGRLAELLAKRRKVAALYDERLGSLDGMQTPRAPRSCTRISWFVYVVRLDPWVDRAALMAALEQRGIPSRPYFTPIHLQPFFQRRFGYRRGDFPVAEDLGDRCLALPFSGVMSVAQVDRVCSELARLLPRCRKPA